MNNNYDQYLYVLQFSLILSNTLNNLKQPFDNCGVTLGQLSHNVLWYHLGTTFGQFGTSFIHLFGKLWNNCEVTWTQLRNHFETTLRLLSDYLETTFGQFWDHYSVTILDRPWIGSSVKPYLVNRVITVNTPTHTIPLKHILIYRRFLQTVQCVCWIFVTTWFLHNPARIS